MLAPIILFVYNRPEHTRKTVEALLKNEFASESELYIFADGPKNDAGDELIGRIRDVRTYIRGIIGFKELNIIEQNHNVGLDTSIINGVTQVLQKHGRCIIVEDDIVTHPWFLRYMNECLEKYKQDERIYMIGGHNVRMKIPWWYRKDVFLVHRGCSWGWATWKDRWETIDWTMQGYDNFLKDEKQQKLFCRGGDDMLPMLIEQMQNEVPAWDIRFCYTLMKKDSYVLLPVKSLVLNYGFDGSGEHCGILDPKTITADLPGGKEYDMTFPVKIEPEYFMQRNFKKFCSRQEDSVLHKYFNLIHHYAHIARLKLWKYVGID